MEFLQSFLIIAKMISWMIYSIYLTTSSKIRISPKMWAERLRTPIYKNGDQNQLKIIAESPSCLLLIESHYLHQEFAVVDKIIACMLWADDHVLFSDTPKGLQRQLDGLTFCASNHMIVNGMETKFMCFGKKSDCKLSFENLEITQVEHYKYVGNIIRPGQALHGDIFGDNYNFLCDKAKKAIFAMKKKLKANGYLPVSCFICLTR